MPPGPRPLTFLPAALLALAVALPAQAPQKPVLKPSEYNRFESFSGDALSPDGKWYAYRLTRVEADGELRYRRVDQDDTDKVVALGLSPVFTRDNRYLAWSTEVSVKERERLTKEKKPITLGLTVLTLGSGEKRSFEGVRASAFSPDGRYLAMQGYAPTEIRGKGATLRVLDLASGKTISFGDVGEYRWSDEGGLLAMTIATGTPHDNGLQIYDPATTQIRSLESSASTYHAMVWRKASSDLAIFRSIAPAGTDRPGETLIVWRGLRGTPVRSVLDSTTAGLGTGYDLVDFSTPRWSTDGNAIAIALRPRPAKSADSAARKPAPAPGDEPSSVQIWHSADVLVYPAQQGRLASEARRTLPALWNVGTGALTRVGNDIEVTASLLDGWHHAVEKPTASYAWGTMFGRRYHDVYLTDLATGERKKIFEKVRYSYESPEGKYLLTFDGKDYSSYEIATGRRTNITAGMKTTFIDVDYDTPTDVAPPEGMAGWLPGDQGVLLYDKYDIWSVSVDGTRREKLTSGRADELIYRIQRLNFEMPSIDPAKPLMLTVTGDRDLKSGYARRLPDGRIERLLYGDKALRALRKADSAEVYMYRAEDRADSPDYFVTGADFTSPRQVTATNTFLPQYAWTREELISFKSEGGIPLKGILLYPANYDPAKKYPMIVYTYERLSQDLHTWQAPTERSYYNQTVWTLNGYFVFLPDIIFKPREPGISTIEAVRAGVRTVAARGLIDPKRVGHVGHSWGGFEAAYLGTHGGDFLATTIAGAAITDLVSFMGQMHWNGGTPESDHSETGQARMQVPYWEDPAAHKRNSPIENVQNMTIPMLLAQGNKDGTVEFFQGTEFYNFARRAGKDVVLLVYDGEDHGFAKKTNQIDYQRRILEWFGHYLKGDPAPKWITDGIKAKDLQDEVKRVAEKTGTP